MVPLMSIYTQTRQRDFIRENSEHKLKNYGKVDFGEAV